MLVDETWSKPGLEELSDLLPSGKTKGKMSCNGLSAHASVSQLEIQKYMRMQPLRDTDWASMTNSLEVRVPFLDLPLFSKLAPAIASKNPPTKMDLANSIGPNVTRIASRAKTGFSTPIGKWLADKSLKSRGLRPWADRVATSFRHLPASARNQQYPRSQKCAF
jgi:asparagine synthase (glutamine-hydrolysing)